MEADLDDLISQMAQEIISQNIENIGFDVANNYGSNVMDEIYYNNEDGIKRKTNQLGGIEGGMTTGEELVVNASMKAIPTMKKPLNSIRIDAKEQVEAHFERSDTCAVSACAVVAESMVAIILANAMLEKFSNDSLSEMKMNFESYQKRVSER